MELSPTDRKEVLKLVAAGIIERIRQEAGGSFSGMIILPMAAVAQIVGLSTKQLPLHLPVTETAPGKHGVTLAAIQAHITRKTRQPAA